MSDKLDKVDPDVIEAIRNQVLKELDDRDAREREKERIKREEDLKTRAEYVQRMKDSPEPWMELVAISADEKGQIKIELDWNGAFVDQLRKNGFSGPDDETVMQRYVAILARDVAEDMTVEDEGE